ncbi:pyridoxamine 5'-phosphate oxidase family protein [Egicoccus halophilus]|uniref:General stress protein n=1 Tax=Egicoccus halophilus TaxID=1670830 RepID=A0A8J3ER87_9ACTN|nr:pyridoxamine 5'-phosphate oxidase family protein [Egicoccus halophilus]GGI04451.1 general stress protein [Egicoccus halophilus]
MSDDARTLDEVLEGERIAMLVTPDQRARPMAILDHEGVRLWFLTNRGAEWVDELATPTPMTVAISDPQDATFVSLTGTARTSSDRALIGRLWSPSLEAWFDGPDDPDVVALEVEVIEGEYWDGPGTGVGRTLRGLAGALTGEGRRTMGEQGDVTT